MPELYETVTIPPPYGTGLPIKKEEAIAECKAAIDKYGYTPYWLNEDIIGTRAYIAICRDLGCYDESLEEQVRIGKSLCISRKEKKANNSKF